MRSICLFACALVAGCHGHTHDEYPTLQACFDEHTVAESLPIRQAIVICCLDHPIAGVSEVCGADHTACEAYVRANLPAVATTDVTAACADYETQKGM
ncbi:MAG: hypothetical protein JNL83_22500 [Myxococcales bacterium]|nr:hypothetical protein [Myxococcales bacterium]